MFPSSQSDLQRRQATGSSYMPKTSTSQQRKVSMEECVNMKWSVLTTQSTRSPFHHVSTQAGVQETVSPSTTWFHYRKGQYSAQCKDLPRYASRCQRSCVSLPNSRAMSVMRRHLLVMS